MNIELWVVMAGTEILGIYTDKAQANKWYNLFEGDSIQGPFYLRVSDA